MKTKLLPKQQLFVREYLIDLNATQAAIRAGYSEKTAGQMGDENLKKPQISAAIAEAQRQSMERLDLSADDVKRMLFGALRADIKLLFDDLGNLKPIKEWPDVFTSTLIPEIVPMFERSDDGTQQGSRRSWDQVGYMMKGLSRAKAQMLEIACKHHGLLVDRVEHGGDVTFRWQEPEPASK